jgi:hypothetical protein
MAQSGFFQRHQLIVAKHLVTAILFCRIPYEFQMKALPSSVALISMCKDEVVLIGFVSELQNSKFHGKMIFI